MPAAKPRQPYPRRYRLTNLRSIRRELAAVYGEARNGELVMGDACRLAFILTGLARVMESADLEARIAALELEGNADG